MTRPPVPSVLVFLTAAMVCLSGIEARAQSVDIGGSVSLTIDSATSAGGGLAPDSDGTTYAVVNPAGTKKLVGRLSSSMPANTTLAVQLDAPSGATSSGTVTLTTTDQNLVTGIGVVNQAGLGMMFTLSATVNAALVSGGTRTFTLTLLASP